MQKFSLTFEKGAGEAKQKVRFEAALRRLIEDPSLCLVSCGYTVDFPAIA